MRRSAGIALAAALVAASVVSSLQIASAGSAAAETVAFEARLEAFKFLDVGKKGESRGDTFIFRDSLWSQSDPDTRIGTRWGKCTLVGGPVVACQATARIDGRGDLTGVGIADLSQQEFSFPIGGGTGDFRNATGEARITAIDETTESVEIALEGVATQ